MSLHIARYLKDFSTPRQPQSVFLREPPSVHGEADENHFDLPQPEPPIDLEAEREQAFAAGRAEAEAELGVRHQGEIEALRAAHAADLGELRLRYEQQAAAMLAERFSYMSEALADRIAGYAANVLAPLLDEALTRKAVADMAGAIRAGLSSGEDLIVTVKGPSHLFEQLKSHFEGDAPVFRHLEATDLDLAAEFGETVLVTRMAAWADTVRKVLA